MERACLLTILAIGTCMTAAALLMAATDQRVAVAKLIAAFALTIMGLGGPCMHEDFPKAMGVALFAMGTTIMLDALMTVGYPYRMDIAHGALAATCFAGASLGMVGTLWEACGREEPA